MCHHENVWLNDCPTDFKPIFYRRYVDDTFLLFSHKSHVQLFLNFVNSKHVNIHFTMETEEGGKLPFLDCTVSRLSNQFITSVYRKRTFSGMGTSFFSFTPFCFKVNSIKTLLYRAYRISSNFLLMHQEFEFLKSYFTNNGFPLPLIESQIKSFLHSRYDSSVEPVNDNPVRYFSFPYFGAKSEKLRQDMSSLLLEYFPDINFKIVFTNKFTIGSFFSYKDKVSLGMRSSLVYQFGCPLCGSRYVGSTTRNLYIRASEHAGRSYRTQSILSCPPHSVVREHAAQCDVPVRLDSFRVLGSAASPSDLRILESLHIFKSKPSINDMSSSIPLNVVGF